jgi:hypothetical protein
MVKKVINISLLVISFVLAQTKPDWKVNPNLAGSNHTIVIPLDANPKVNGVPLQAGDYIGVFYDSLGIKFACGGFKMWEGDKNIAISALGDDIFTNDKKEGFSANENFVWKVWKKSNNQIYDVAVQFKSGQVVYTPNGTSIIQSLGDKVLPPWTFNTTTVFHTIVLPKSLNIVVNKIKQVPPIYVGGFFDSLGNKACAGYGEWNGAADVEFKIYGDNANTVQKEGFFNNEKITFYIFIVAERKIVEVKAKVRSDSPNDTFFIPNGRTILDSLISLKIISATDPGWVFTPTTNYHKVIFPSRQSVKIDDYYIEDGDFVGAFYKKSNDTLACAGFFQWNGDFPQELTIWADYPDTRNKEGYSVGDKITLLVWRKASQSTFFTNVKWINDKYNYPNDSIFAISSIYKDTIKLGYGLSGVELLTNVISEKYFLEKSFFFNDYKLQTSYRIISLPGVPIRSNSYLLDSLFQGVPNRDWIGFKYSSDGKLIPYENKTRGVFKFAPGKAFWVLSKVPLIIDRSNYFQAYNVPTNVILKNDKIVAYYEIPLDTTGNLWNIIANPFDQPVNWKDIIDFNNSDFLNKPIFETDNIYEYLGTQGYKKQAILEPYRGYFYYNRTKLKKLKIPYPLNKTFNKISSNNYQYLNLMISNEQDTTNLIVWNVPTSTKDYDRYDELLPPISFNSLTAFIENTSANIDYKKFKSDARYIGIGQKYNLKVVSKNGGIKFKLDNKLNDDYRIIFVNKSNGKVIDLKNLKEFEYTNNLSDTLSFDLLIGTEEFFKNTNVKIEKFELYQNYPNPFNPKTKINFSIPENLSNYLVELKVYDILGREIATLINKNLPSGIYSVDFDGNNLSSGVYFAKLSVANKTKFIKMQLIK